MNNNKFDNIIKESLDGLSVTPSSTIGKSLSRKMVLKNIWFFHKKKALLTILIASITYFNSTSFNQEPSNSANIVQNKSIIKNGELKTNKKIKTTNLPSENKTGNNVIKTTQESKEESYNKPLSIYQAENTNNSKTKNKSLKSKTVNSELNSISILTKEQLIAVNSIKNLEKKNENKFKNYKINAFPIENKIRNEIIDFDYLASHNNDYTDQKKGIISFDAFFTPYNQTNIKNKVDGQYSENWWDFYRTTGYINSKIEAGLRVNYDWKNIVATTGFNYNRIVEYKPTYLYESYDTEDILSILGLSEISGVQVNGVDSAHYIFYTSKDDELIDRLENEEYNTYSYLSIPLKLGYEFKTSKFSVLVQAGINYNKLIGAKGTYLRRYTNNETLDIYYNKGIETALLTRKNSMLKQSNISFLASIAGNIKVSPVFDLFGEFTCQQSQSSITQKEYFIQKNTTNFGTNFGVKYYLEPRIKRPTTLQEVF